MISEPTFTIGIEEEYIMVDRDTRNALKEVPAGLMDQLVERLGQQVSTEFLQCQVEVGTRVCHSVEEARDELCRLRQVVANVLDEYGLGFIAASTHPFATAAELEHTHSPRYQALAEDLQQVIRRLLISGMHVHVGVEDDELRMDMLGQAAYILPHLLALSTSSPFWQGQDTGLMSYRISVWDEMPRTGLPGQFASYAEYHRHVDILVQAGVIEDATKIWWDLRPSARFPTLEMRITDVCTSINDAICIAAIFQCWLRLLYRLRLKNQRWRRYEPMLVEENRWRAHRYGIAGELIDFGRGALIPYSELLDEILDLIREDAENFGCVSEVEHARQILTGGSSSHRQLGVYQSASERGADHQDSLCAVVDHLQAETKRGLD